MDFVNKRLFSTNEKAPLFKLSTFHVLEVLAKVISFVNVGEALDINLNMVLVEYFHVE